jgi:hypothetical protein
MAKRSPTDPLTPAESPSPAPGECQQREKGTLDNQIQCRSDHATESGEFPEEISPAIARSVHSFREAVPDLLKTRYRQWVAIENGRIIKFARSKTRLYRKLERQLDSGDIKEEELLVCCVLPEDPDDVDVTPAFRI